MLRALCFSGNANNGANAGFVYSNSDNSWSNANANIGSQLCLEIYNELGRTLHRKPCHKNATMGGECLV